MLENDVNYDPETMGDESLDDEDCSYLVPEVSLGEHIVRIVEGDKLGSRWLVVGEHYIFHRNDTSLDGEQVYWECSRRKQAR